jgi:predicted nucleic acid-binding protein
MRNGSPAILVDTNLLVYLYDPREKMKQTQAERVVRQLTASGRLTLSTQVLAEFCSVAVRKLRAYVSAEDLARQVDSWIRALPVLDLTPAVIPEALRGVRDHQLSYWDAQIWATARLNRIPTVLSEDFSDGSSLEGVSFVNPFSAAFDPARLP